MSTEQWEIISFVLLLEPVGAPQTEGEGAWRPVEVVGTSRPCLDPMGSALVRGGAQGGETAAHQVRGGCMRELSLAAQDNRALQLATKGPLGF